MKSTLVKTRIKGRKAIKIHKRLLMVIPWFLSIKVLIGGFDNDSDLE